MNDLEYKKECDRLSQLEILEECVSFGRWFIEDNMLSTWICTPKIGRSVVGKLFLYQRSLDELKNKENREKFLEEIQEKVWLGDKGYKDLQRALKKIFKKDLE